MRRFILLVILSVFARAHAASDFSDTFQKRLKSSGLQKSEVGVWIGSGSETYFESQADKSMIPASLTKIFTAAGAFKSMPPGYKFKTLIVATAEPEGSQLKGDIYLVGGGDPSFISETMWFLVNEFRRTGVTRINGDILVDESRFDGVLIDEDRESVRNDRAYDAPVSALSMNWNSVSVYVRPGAKAGDPCRVFVDVESPYFTTSNLCKTTEKGSANLRGTVSVERRAGKSPAVDQIVVAGKAALSADEIVIYKNISNPALGAGYNLREFLKQRGIELTGQVRPGTAPPTAKILAAADSKPILDIVADMSKWSNNYVAEMLTKNISFEKGDKPGTMEAGLKSIRSYIESVPVKFGKKDEFIFLNPAGFSRDNRTSSRFLGSFLDQVRSEFSFFPEYLSSLPIAGVDGTLRKRMVDTAATRMVRAKTGLLNGVAGLAGYVPSRDGGLKSFVFLYNGRAGSEEKARHLFDQLAADLVEALK